MQVIAGAPNIVRGGSHSGNVAAADLVRQGAVDAFASDYVPASLIEAAFGCARDTGSPCRRGGPGDRPPRPHGRLPDRGRIAAGLRADLVRVRVHEGLPIVRQVWQARGERVFDRPAPRSIYAPRRTTRSGTPAATGWAATRLAAACARRARRCRSPRTRGYTASTRR